jgi:ATPase subunit of ABC transporter with duplicated ATPase domains
MSALHFRRVTFSYPSREPVLVDVDLHLVRGWTGLVGANGSGKTTLLRLASGALSPDSGAVVREPGHLSFHMCSQRARMRPPEVEEFSWAWDRRSIRLRAALALDGAASWAEGAATDAWSRLSPGERKRWQVGAALWSRPDVLVLDEPTNHLDADATDLLLAALDQFDGIGVMVSHDRRLLDAVSTSTVRLNGGRASKYPGGYTAARALWTASAEAMRGAADVANRKVQRLRHRLGRARGDRAAAGRQLSTATRMSGPKDSDARTVAAKARVAKGERRLSQKVSVLGRELSRARDARAGIDVETQLGGQLFVGYERASQRRIISFQCGELRAGGRGHCPAAGRAAEPGPLPSVRDAAGGRVLARDVNLLVERDSRLRLTGRNGAGKTTLLRAALACCCLSPDEILVLPQQLPTAGEAADRVEHARAMPRELRTRVFHVLAALGVSPQRLLGSAAPSPGEIRKLALAIGLGRRARLLVLDEPTNHLDLPSIERLETALAAYPGAIVLVTHDGAFAEAVGTVPWQPEWTPDSSDG